MELKDLISKIEDVQNDILDYIVSTEHYIFNWIYDKKVQEFIEGYPDDYEDRIYLRVIKAGVMPTIRIYFEDHPEELEYIERDAFLPTFKDSAKARWLEWNGNVKEIQIAQKEKEVKYFKEQLEKTKKELEELKK
jgi:hypothetical protein